MAAQISRRVTLEKRYLAITIEIQEVLQVLNSDDEDLMYWRRDQLEEEAEKVAKRLKRAQDAG